MTFKVLDLFCGAGGAAMGYAQALESSHIDDWEIVGMDDVPQWDYPFEFIQGDATATNIYDDFDFIHASPPCQAYSTLRHAKGVTQPDGWELPFIQMVLQSAKLSGAEYVIENVPGAPLADPVTLCGSMFGLVYEGFELRRHRLFETSFQVAQPKHDHRLPVLGVYGDLSRNARASQRGVKAGIRQARALMGIDWMHPKHLVQAIPPAYTRHVMESYLSERR